MPTDQESWQPTVQVFAVKHADGPFCIETHNVELLWKPGTVTKHLPAVVSEWIAAGILSSGRLRVGLRVPACPP